MSQGRGFKKQIGIGEQTVFATKVSPTQYLEFTDEAMTKEIEEILSQGIIGTAGYRRRMLGAIKVGGTIDFEVFPTGAIGLILEHAMGAVANTQPDASGNPTVYLHTYTLADALHAYGLTVSVDRDISVKDYFGCKVGQLELTAAVNAILMAKVTLVGKDASAGTTMTPAYPTLNPFIFTQGTFTIGGSAIEVSNFTLSLNNGLREDRYGIKTDATRQGIERVNRREVTGSFILPYEAETLYDEFIAGTSASLVLLFESSTISGAYKNSLTITIPVSYYQSFTPGTGGVAMSDMTVPFRGIEKITAPTAKEFTIALQNTDTSY